MRWGGQKLQCCPECGSANAAIIDSRYIEEVGWKRRRRECHACNHRWSTVELPAELIGGLETLFTQLKQIERIAAESRLTLTGGSLAINWETGAGPPADGAPQHNPPAPRRTCR